MSRYPAGTPASLLSRRSTKRTASLRMITLESNSHHDAVPWAGCGTDRSWVSIAVERGRDRHHARPVRVLPANRRCVTHSGCEDTSTAPKSLCARWLRSAVDRAGGIARLIAGQVDDEVGHFHGFGRAAQRGLEDIFGDSQSSAS